MNAQFDTPNINGTVAAAEYGVHTDRQNQKSTSTAQNWYLTWDDLNLYLALTNANLAEGAVLYLDRNPLSPSNGGTNADGNLTGVNYDGTNFSALPFHADFAAYFKNGCREYRTADGAGGWNTPTSVFGSYASGTGNLRELSIPWTSINPAGRPAGPSGTPHRRL